MDISQEKLDEAEVSVLKVFNDYDIQYQEAALICIDILAMVSINSGFPFENFQKMCNELIVSLEESWPIG